MKASEKATSAAARKQLQDCGYNLPPHDALAQVLPDYLASGGKTELQHAARQEPNTADGKPTYKTHHAHKRASLREFEDDPQMAKVTDLQTEVLENYRAAMSKMAEDIILLRTQIVALEAENSQLRTDLSLHQDLGRDLLKDTDVDVMTKAEISDLITSLKFKMASETSKAAAQRDRIQQLQNELIKKNDSEKELLKLQRVHRRQEQLQQQHDRFEKIATLEATVKQQEKVIEKMEKALDNKIGETKRQSEDKRLVLKKHRSERGPRQGEAESALAAENARLREELGRIRQQPPAVIIQQPAKMKEALPLKEKLSLQSKLVKAEARVRSLEAQLEENSELWGRQKQDMLNTLSEHRQGFVRTATPHRVSLNQTYEKVNTDSVCY